MQPDLFNHPISFWMNKPKTFQRQRKLNCHPLSVWISPRNEFSPIHRRLNYIRKGDERYYGSFGRANYNSTPLTRHYPISIPPPFPPTPSHCQSFWLARRKFLQFGVTLIFRNEVSFRLRFNQETLSKEKIKHRQISSPAPHWRRKWRKLVLIFLRE